VPTTVLVFRSDSSFRPYKPVYNNRPAELAGLFQAGEDVNYIALAVGGSGRNEAYPVIFHEYVHLLIKNNLANVPLWFNEGLAEYYSTFEVSDDRRVTLGQPIANHILFLQRERRMLRLADLFSVTHDSPYYNERDRRSVFYAQSWALVHYLMMSEDRGRRVQLARFLDLLTTNRPVEETFREAFGMDIAAVEREFSRYIARTSFPIEVFTFNERLQFDDAMESATLTEAQAQAHLGDYLLHINRLDAAEEHLTRALALDANLASAHASFGMLRVRQERASDAITHLRRAVEQPSANYLTHYYYAYALSREGMDSNRFVSGYPAEKVELMRTQLRRAITLAPHFTESYHLLAFVNLVMNEQLDESIALLRRAIELSPGEERYRMMLAQIYMRKRDFNTARRVVEPVAQNGADRRARAEAQSMLSAIAQMESVVARNAEMEAMARWQQSEMSNVSSTTQPREAPQFDPTTRLRRRAEGEMGVRGTLQRIECTAEGVAIIIQTETGVRRFTRDKLERIRFITFTADIGRTITCGARTPPNSVLITYRQPTGRRVPNSDGEVVAVEFLPADFDNR
jgi:tetratricopeptide (TPR) repeat protein